MDRDGVSTRERVPIRDRAATSDRVSTRDGVPADRASVPAERDPDYR
jgi:hypothetical protein